MMAGATASGERSARLARANPVVASMAGASVTMHTALRDGDNLDFRPRAGGALDVVGGGLPGRLVADG